MWAKTSEQSFELRRTGTKVNQLPPASYGFPSTGNSAKGPKLKSMNTFSNKYRKFSYITQNENKMKIKQYQEALTI